MLWAIRDAPPALEPMPECATWIGSQAYRCLGVKPCSPKPYSARFRNPSGPGRPQFEVGRDCSRSSTVPVSESGLDELQQALVKFNLVLASGDTHAQAPACWKDNSQSPDLPPPPWSGPFRDHGHGLGPPSEHRKP